MRSLNLRALPLAALAFVAPVVGCGGPEEDITDETAEECPAGAEDDIFATTEACAEKPKADTGYVTSLDAREMELTLEADVSGSDLQEAALKSGQFALTWLRQNKDLYIQSLVDLGINPKEHDIRFVEDDWESPTLGAWGLGWEVWLDGMEVTQFTYFQEVGGLACKPVLGEITYGLERLAMYLQGKDSVFDLVWTPGVTYRDVYHQNEVEQSKYNFELSNVELLFNLFKNFESEAKRLIEAQCVLPGYEMVMKASHTFNLLDARGAISVTERAAYIGRVRTLARAVAEAYYASRERLGFPMLKKAA